MRQKLFYALLASTVLTGSAGAQETPPPVPSFPELPADVERAA